MKPAKPWGGPRAGAGRKVTLAVTSRLKPLSVGVRPSEKASIEAQARSALIPVSTWLRMKLGLPRVPPAA